ncbi:MAG: hypothetical protein KAK00_06700 [Nanoarchaeota archaeon]|nr:hypothetical protein [Nanoarchaeota archaeon]
MIQKIKDLLRIKEEISELSKKFDENTNLVNNLNENISSLKNEIDALKDSQNNLAAKFKEDSDLIKETKEELRKEISDFKLIKSRLETKLVEKFDEEIKKELLPRFDRLERHVKEFEELGVKVAIIAKRVVTLGSELQKFCDISNNIKTGDFELTNFAQQLKSMDNEKLELMRKIDTLERLISKMRRSSR